MSADELVLSATSEEISRDDIDLDDVDENFHSEEEAVADGFEDRIRAIRLFAKKQIRRMREEDKRMEISDFTRHEVELLGRVSSCTVRRRLLRLGII